MDELTIDDKKYVSSKQAAKITGYAKDYIGQLCREGRVPARLVGRNWYVLESAISDHRFGPPQVIPASAPEPEPRAKEPSEPMSGRRTSRHGSVADLPQTWEAPRYASVEPELLPQLNRMEQAEAEAEPTAGDEELVEPLMDSWRNWFDHIAEIAPEARGRQEEAAPQELSTEDEPMHGTSYVPHQVVEHSVPDKEVEAEPQEEQALEEEIDIPIHTVYDLPPRELLPRYHEAHTEADTHVRPQRSYMGEQGEVASGEDGEGVEIYEETMRKPRTGALRGAYAVIQVSGVLIAVGAIGVATVASGYFDAYIGSFSQASAVTGISVYEK